MGRTNDVGTKLKTCLVVVETRTRGVWGVVSEGWLLNSPPRNRGDRGPVSGIRKPVFSSVRHLPRKAAVGIK